MLLNSVMNLLAPPATMVVMAFAWPSLCFISTCERLYNSFFATEDMEDKVVVITGASSAIGEQIAYEYAKRKANLVLVARRDQRLHSIRSKTKQIGAKQVMIIAADVVKEDECRRFINEAFNYYGHVDHLVNTASLGHEFYFEDVSDTTVFPRLLDINFWGNVYPTYVALPYLQKSNGRIIVNASVESWLPLPRMSLYSAAKAALANFYETLRFELNGDVGITIAIHGWIGSEMSRGKFKLEEGNGGEIEEFAKMIVDGACRGDSYVKFPSWYDVFLLYRAFTPNVLKWTFRLLLSTEATRRNYRIEKEASTIESTPRLMLEESPPPKIQASLPKFSLQEWIESE
ncbi:unnamed protein product [Thlaspi arvense]|uniref:Uncharacterized protein n=1 Tax=Thlaspi arvense TaxID=13288 RepID=A0AAU9R8B2_THLAR|nr:unnamed protein product [Thlaspi arvense]